MCKNKNNLKQLWLIYGCHEYAPSATKNFTGEGVSFSWGRKHMKHLWWLPLCDRSDRRTNRQTNRWTASLHKALTLRWGL